MPKTSTKPRKSAGDDRAAPSPVAPIAPSAATRAFASKVAGTLGTTVLKDSKTGTETKIDSAVAALMQRLLADLAAGHAVTIVQSNRDLTTFEAAEILGVSRPYLIRLIERGDIPCHRVGTHRRIRSADLLAYKAKFDKRRDEALAEITRISQAHGEY
jgi:excisionase family DNA binding protein